MRREATDLAEARELLGEVRDDPYASVTYGALDRINTFLEKTQ